MELIDDIPQKLVNSYITEYHEGDMYGGLPYLYHLFRVANKIAEVAIIVNMNEERLNLLFKAALLHDIVEDHPEILELAINNQDNSDLIKCQCVFGTRLGEIVWRLTDEKAETRAERKKLTLSKTFSHPDSCLIKIADRICNLQQGIIEGNMKKGQMYVKEHETFMAYVKLAPNKDDISYTSLVSQLEMAIMLVRSNLSK